MHHIEEEVFRTFQVQLEQSQPTAEQPLAQKQGITPPPQVADAAAAALDPAAVSAAVASWGVSDRCLLQPAASSSSLGRVSLLVMTNPISLQISDCYAGVLLVFVLVPLCQEPAALQALIVEATARLVALAEAGNSSHHTEAPVDAVAVVPAPAPALALAPGRAAARAAAAAGGAAATKAPTKPKHMVDDMEEGTFEGSVDAMDGFLDDLGDDSD